jgi:putative spermidine/putrescine transport system permease protein
MIDGEGPMTRITRLQLLLMLLPALLCIAPFVATLVLIGRFSLSAEPAAIEGFSLHNFAVLAEPFYFGAFLTTLRLASIATLIVIVLAVPIALLMASITKAWLRRLMSTLILLPLFLNLLIQSYGWIMLLGPAGLANRLLLDSGLTKVPLRFLFSETGVLIGLVQTSLPLAVFPIFVGMSAISKDYLEAAASLGGGAWSSLRSIILPLLTPSIVAAASIAFAYNASAFAVPLLLGGRRVQMLGVVIRDQIAPLLDFAGASATGVMLILVTTAAMTLGGIMARRATARA